MSIVFRTPTISLPSTKKYKKKLNTRDSTFSSLIFIPFLPPLLLLSFVSSKSPSSFHSLTYVTYMRKREPG
jgi:hypothetical protein